MNNADLESLLLTFKLAFIVAGLLLLIGTPIAFWLSQSKSKLKVIFESIVALPLVLPPTVLGFYLLVAMGPKGIVGWFTQSIGIGYLPFSFAGLIVGSFVYSLPFVVQPLQVFFETVGSRPFEVAASLRASPLDTFINVIIPMAAPSFFSAFVFAFAHTIGEFGVVLMLGGNIPGETQLVSISIYDHVEAIRYSEAHFLSGLLLVISFILLTTIFIIKRKNGVKSWIR
jgi:molybdate transport system permease protein